MKWRKLDSFGCKIEWVRCFTREKGWREGREGDRGGRREREGGERGRERERKKQREKEREETEAVVKIQVNRKIESKEKKIE